MHHGALAEQITACSKTSRCKFHAHFMRCSLVGTVCRDDVHGHRVLAFADLQEFLLDGIAHKTLQLRFV